MALVHEVKANDVAEINGVEFSMSCTTKIRLIDYADMTVRRNGRVIFSVKAPK